MEIHNARKKSDHGTNQNDRVDNLVVVVVVHAWKRNRSRQAQNDHSESWTFLMMWNPVAKRMAVVEDNMLKDCFVLG